MSERAGDELTVLVFKDNLASRTFRVPLAWISRFGISVAILLGFSAICMFAAVKYYRVASMLNPARVEQLQNELDRVKEDYELRIATLQRQASDTLAAAPVSISAPPQPPGVVSAVGRPVLFADIPAPSSGDDSIPQEASLPFVISQPRTSWASGNFEASFNIQYTNTNGGSQQGRIIVLARGPEALLVYPAQTFNRSGSTALINPNKGEYFSVSRFREVKATFPHFKNRGDITEVEIVLFDPAGRVLLHRAVAATRSSDTEVLPAGIPEAISAPVTAPVAVPVPGAASVILPGTSPLTAPVSVPMPVKPPPRRVRAVKPPVEAPVLPVEAPVHPVEAPSPIDTGLDGLGKSPDE